MGAGKIGKEKGRKKKMEIIKDIVIKIEKNLDRDLIIENDI